MAAGFFSLPLDAFFPTPAIHNFRQFLLKFQDFEKAQSMAA